MRLETLVVTNRKDVDTLLDKINIGTDTIVVSETVDDVDDNNYKIWYNRDKRVRQFSGETQRQATCRNIGLEVATGDILIIGSEDMLYYNNTPEKIRIAFNSHQDADVIVFNLNMELGKQTYRNKKWRRLKKNELGIEKYVGHGIALRTDVVRECNLRFRDKNICKLDTCSLFLKDAMKCGLRVYLAPIVIGYMAPELEKQLDRGTEKDWFELGVLSRNLYGRFSYIYTLWNLHKEKKNLLIDGKRTKSEFKHIREELFRGIRDGKNS